MATPLFDSMSIELSRRVNDPVAAAATNGQWLSSLERTSYLNKAMLLLINEAWTTLNGDKKKFVEIFPELVKISGELTLSSRQYSLLASGTYDYYALLEVTTGTTGAVNNYCSIIPKHLYQAANSGNVIQFKGSTGFPIAVEISKVITILPTTVTDTKAIITYIAMPVSPTDGSLIVQGGSIDSPFSIHWNSKIVEIAEKLVRIETGETI